MLETHSLRMVSALVLVNCRFPFDTGILKEISSLSIITKVFRTEGRYDLILKASAETEEKLKEAIANNIENIPGVDGTISLTIVEKPI